MNGNDADWSDTAGSTRRRLLRVASAAGTAGLAGCTDNLSSLLDDDGSNAASDVSEAEDAVIRIETEGAYAQYGEDSSDEVEPGAGSGFIIDSSGTAVTNNHVITGAVTLDVFVGSDQEPHDTKVLGVSECADLAVLDIDGDGRTYLNWFEEEISRDLRVWSLGYPGGDPSYTTTQGTVMEIYRPADTNWASVGSAIEHSAQVEGGNSGGPLVAENGRVVGINFGYLEAESAQPFAPTSGLAIEGNVAQGTLEQLREGENVQSIGISGFAIPADGYSHV